MTFTIILMNGREYDVTESEKESFLGKSGFVFVPRLNLTINTTSISTIEPKGLGKKIDRLKQLEGRLHDGSRVVKHFGQWKDADNPDVHISPSYYPEIAGDFVVTPDEYREHIEKLPSSERLEKMRALVHDEKTSVPRLGSEAQKHLE